MAVAFVVLAAIPAADATDGSESGAGAATPVSGFPEAVDGVITLTADVSYALTKDITVEAKQIDLAGFDLSVSGKGTLTLKAKDLGTSFLTNSSTEKQSTVSVIGAKLVITNSDLGKHEVAGDSLVLTNVKDAKGIAFVADQKATLDFESNDSSVSTIQTASGNTTIAINGGSKLVYNAGSAQAVGVVVDSSTADIKNLEGTTFAAYWCLRNSTVNATDIDIYAASLTNKSSFNVKGFAAFYSNTNGTNAFTGKDLADLELSTVVVDSSSTISAKTFYTAFNYASSYGAIAFSGEGKVTGGLEFVHTVKVKGTDYERENLKGYLLNGVLFNGTASYTDTDQVLSSAKFVNVRGDSTDGLAVKAGSIVLSGTISQADVDAAGSSITISGEGEILDNVTIPSGVTVEVAKGATLTVDSGATLSGEGKVSVSGEFSNAGTVNLPITIVDEGKITGTNASGVITVYDAMRTVYIGNGSEITGTTYGPEQRVEVVGNATIVGDMVVEGLLYVNKDAVLTIEENGSLTIKGANVSVVEGSLVLLEGADLNIQQNAVLNIVGSMSVEGDVTVDRDSNAQIVFKQGADANIGGKLDAKKVVIEDSATLTLSGAVAAGTVFDVVGTLNIDSRDAVSERFTVNLDKGTVDIANVVLGVTGKDAEITGLAGNSGKATITVTDKGTVIYNDKDKEISTTVNQPNVKNQVTIEGIVTTTVTDTIASGNTYDAGARVSGVKIVSELKVTKIAYKDGNKGTKTAYDGTPYDSDHDGLYEHAYTMTVSGAMSQAGEVFYEGTDATIDVASSIATISVDGKTSAKIGETSVGNWMSLTASDNVAVSGALSLAPRTNTTATDREKSNAASATFDGETSVEAAVTVGAGASITFDGETSVKASIDATAVSSVKAQAVLGTNGKIVVSENGSIAVVGGITSSTGVTITSLVEADEGTTGNLSAAVYTVGTTNPVTYYVDVDAAIAAMAAGTTDRVSVYGTQTVDASASILANDTLTLEADSVLVVGSEDDGEDVVLTLEKDSALKTKTPAPAQVVVNGTLHAVNKKNVQSTLLGEGVISSEVYSCETDDKGAPVSSGWAEWTNLNNALRNAEAGETIQVMKDADIEGTIKEGVTVKSGENVLTVKQKKTLNVAGVLDITGGTLFIEQATKNKTTNAIETAAGAVVLTGRIVLGDIQEMTDLNVLMGTDSETAEFYILAGAYYRIDGAMEISTPAYAAGKIASVEDYFVGILSWVDARDNAISEDDEKFGTVDLGEIAFTGKSADESANVAVVANIVSAAITLENASVTFPINDDDGITVDATFKGAESSVAVVGKVSGLFTVSEGAFGESVEHALMVSGKIGDIDFTKKSDSSMKIEGTVYAIPGSDIAVDSVAVSGTLVIAKKDAAATDAAEVKIVALAVSGTLEVKDGAKLTVSGTMKIAGDASVKDGSEISVKTLEVSGALVIVEGKVVVNDMATVSGTVDAAALNEEKSNYVATFSAAKLYIGTDSKTVGAAASVTGNVSAGTYAVVAAGATAPAVFTGEDAFLASEKYVSTAFTVDGAAYMTVYTKSSNQAIKGVFEADKDEALFAGWYYKDSKGAEKAVGDGTYVGAVTEVYAKFIDGIYRIFIEADGGVAYVTVDGKLMSKDPETGKFFFKGLTAGTHKIEISAAAGYDVSKTALYNSDGTAVGSMSIVLSDGKDADLGIDGAVVYNDVSYQLIGSTVAVEPTPEPTPIIIKDDKDDMSLTDILLIVLVVLIVIMAAIVALRMMRS